MDRFISDQQIIDLERRIAAGMTTAADVELHRQIIDQIKRQVRGR